MTRMPTLAGALSAALALAACGQPEQPAAETPAVAAPATAGSNGADAPGSSAGAPKIATGRGTVTAVDAASGAVTIDHGPIPAANWPAMTMTFKAAPALAQSVRVGDRVEFDFALGEGGNEITAIRKP